MRIQNLSLILDNLLILENISFDILPNTINLLLGPNGAGKSSLLKCISGNQKSYTGIVATETNTTISFMPQKINISKFLPITPDEIFDHMHMRKNIYDLVINICDWPNIRNKKLFTLSEGTIKKIFLILILVQKSSYIILDEPTANLDIKSQNIFYDALNEIRKDTAVIFSSNELHTIHSQIDQVLCLNKTLYKEHLHCKTKCSDYSIYLHDHCN